MRPGLYEVTTETLMPHLEEALRYATTRETRCLTHQDLASAFPVLRHDSLKGCRLDPETADKASVSYFLICGSTSGTTGAARWQRDGDRLRGTLDVRLGGKNMTFSQRVTATTVGPCPTAAK